MENAPQTSVNLRSRHIASNIKVSKSFCFWWYQAPQLLQACITAQTTSMQALPTRKTTTLADCSWQSLIYKNGLSKPAVISCLPWQNCRRLFVVSPWLQPSSGGDQALRCIQQGWLCQWPTDPRLCSVALASAPAQKHPLLNISGQSCQHMITGHVKSVTWAQPHGMSQPSKGETAD